MTVNMKPYDPEHKGDFCTRDGRTVRILATDRKSKHGNYPVVGLVANGNGDETYFSWSRRGEIVIGLTKNVDLMCVIPKREARVHWVNSSGFVQGRETSSGYRVREVMPDDISQEKARAVIEAARDLLDTLKGRDQPHENRRLKGEVFEVASAEEGLISIWARGRMGKWHFFPEELSPAEPPQTIEQFGRTYRLDGGRTDAERQKLVVEIDELAHAFCDHPDQAVRYAANRIHAAIHTLAMLTSPDVDIRDSAAMSTTKEPTP